MSRRSLAASILGLTVSLAAITADRGASLQALTPSASATDSGPRSPRQSGAAALILGQVVDAESRQPLAGTVVTLFANGAERGRGIVDTEGRFAFTALPPGRYLVRAEKAGYLRGGFGRTHPAGAPLAIDLLADQRLAGIEISMWRFGSISGRVVDDAGEPIVGVAVRTVPTVAGPIVKTDDRGIFRLAQLPPNRYIIVIPARLSTRPAESEADAVAGADPAAAASDAGSSAARTVRIGDLALTAAGNVPMPPVTPDDARLHVYRPTFYPSTPTRADAQAITLTSGEDRIGINIVLTPVPSFRVSGRVTGPEGALAGTNLRLVQGDGTGTEDAISEIGAAVTNASGTFTFLGVPPGDYMLRVLSPAIGTTGTRPDARPSLWAARRVRVTGADIADLAIAARVAPTFAGRIDVTGTKPLPPDGFELIVEAIDGGPFRVVNPRVDANKRFSTQLAPGRYSFAVYHSSGSWCTSVTMGGRELFGEPIDVVDADVSNLVVSCGGEPTRLIGTVRDDRGEIDARTSVVAFPVDRRYWAGELHRPQLFAATRVTTSGVYTLVNLRAGEYYVAAIPDSASVTWKDRPVLDVLSATATRVTLTAGQSPTINLRTTAIR